MISAVDTNILLDLLIPNAPYVEGSLACLSQAAEVGSIIIGEIAFAELSSQFPGQDDFVRFLSETMIQLAVSDERVLWEAGRVWKEYVKSKRRGAVCPVCGKSISITCRSCKNPIRAPKHMISDFLIGAHARIFADQLITRDRGFYRKYFQDLKILDPSRKS
jgi:hypothetical protein